MQVFTALISVVVGWVLGISGNFLVEAMRDKKRRKQLRGTLNLELIELRYKIAFLIYGLNIRLGIFNKELLNMLAPIIMSYEGPEIDDKMKDIFKNMLQMDPSVISAYAQKQKQDGKAKALKKYNLPFFESQIQYVSLLSAEVQASLLSIHERLNLINQDVEKYWFYFEKTFDSSINEVNLEKIHKNINGCFAALIRQGCLLLDRINQVLIILDNK